MIESRRVVLPLKGVECEFSVRGGLADVCMSQIFRQENPNPLDCEYLFPLPADASVYCCEANVNGRIIRAEIKERGEARKFAADKKAAGFRTALVESERENLFTLSLGNVQPDDLIVIRLKYFQTLRAMDEARSVEIPFCPGVRYIPGKPLLRSNSGKGVVDDTDEVPDASRISPVRIDADNPDAAYIDVRGKLDAKYVDQRSLISPSHSIDVQPSPEELLVTLSSKGEVPDRDFVLRWSESNADTVAPRAWLREKENEAYALLEVRAPKHVSVQETALDFYFLVDRSGSMQGQKWSKAVEALQSCVNVLGPDDRAMVTLFETGFQDFAEGPLPVRTLLEDGQFQRLRAIGTGGGTNMAPALKHVLDIAGKASAGRDRNLILITDAQIGNETAILNLMKTAPDMAVHCFGIDIVLNDALLLALSRQQGGTFHSLNPNDNIQAVVTKLGKTLRQPVLLDLRLPEGWECGDAKIPNLYAGQILYLSAKAKTKIPLELTARGPLGESVSFSFERHVLAEETPFLHWSKTRIQRLVAEGKKPGAIALSIASNLLCRLTAFVAWDDSEKVIISRHELVQPSMEFDSLLCAAGRADVVGFCATSGLFARELHDIRRSYAHSGTRDSSSVMEIAQKLHDTCQIVVGDESQPFYKAIIVWLYGSSRDELTKAIDAVNRLLQKLTVCSKLWSTLHLEKPGDAGWVRQISICQLEFRQIQQRSKTDDVLFKDLEELFRRVEKVDASTSQEQLVVLAGDIRRRMFELLKSFADSLVARK